MLGVLPGTDFVASLFLRHFSSSRSVYTLRTFVRVLYEGQARLRGNAAATRRPRCRRGAWGPHCRYLGKIFMKISAWVGIYRAWNQHKEAESEAEFRSRPAWSKIHHLENGPSADASLEGRRRNCHRYQSAVVKAGQKQMRPVKQLSLCAHRGV